MNRITKIIASTAFGMAITFGIIAGVVNINIENGKTDATVIYSEEGQPAVIEGDRGEVIETERIDGEPIPTVEEVDGGMFEDSDSGLSMLEGDYDDLGAAVETFDTKTPEDFKNATLGKCIYANNRYGAQCVSLSRSFWWSYAGRDISTCGTGMAKGMMNCWQQNAGNDFEVYWSLDKGRIQSGDWLVFDGGQYGHVGMALGPVKNGYVALLGENQGGKSCQGGGAAVNIINISVKNLIGFYRPKAYIKVAPTPAPKPTPISKPAPVVDSCKVRKVQKGDTMGKIMKECMGKTEWGEAMDEYAKHWYSTGFKFHLTVFDGWASRNGVGLFVGDTIEYKD